MKSDAVTPQAGGQVSASEVETLDTAARVWRSRRSVAQTRRAAHRLGLADLMGSVSERVPGSSLLAVSPGWDDEMPTPASVTIEDTVVVDLGGEAISGDPHSAPADLELHLGIYRARRDVGAVVYGSPASAIAFGAAGRAVLPLTHTQSMVLQDGVGVHVPDKLITTRDAGAEVAAALGGGLIAHVVGLGVVAVGPSALQALMNLDAYEYLARMTAVTASLTEAPRTLSKQEVATVPQQRPLEVVPSRDPRRYYTAFAEIGGRGGAPEHDPCTEDPVGDVKVRMALACRMLAARHSLVAYFEHLSARLPGTDDRFAMSPAKAFSRMQPDDILTVGVPDDCAWLEGPYAPAPFRWFHRDILQARPDVNAIVHTHELYGRAFVMSGIPLEPVFRTGADTALLPLPVYDVPTLNFSAEDRSATVALLGDGSMVHLVAHGTDFVATSLEQATVMAIHREFLCEVLHLARRLGTVRGMAPGLIDEVRRLGPTARAWWRYYAADTPDSSV